MSFDPGLIQLLILILKLRRRPFVPSGVQVIHRETPAQVWGYGTKELTDKDGFTIAGVKQVLDDLEDIGLGGHTISGTKTVLDDLQDIPLGGHEISGTKTKLDDLQDIPTTGHEISGTKTKLDDLQDLTAVEIHTGTMTASDNLKLSSDAEVSTTSPSFVKKKEFYIRIPGTYRIKFDLKKDAGATNAEAELYLNGVTYGTTRTTVSTTYVTYSEDLRLDDGDLIQLYMRVPFNDGTAYAENLRLYGVIAIGSGVENSV